MVAQRLRPLAAPNSRRPRSPSQNRTKYDYDKHGLITEVHSDAGWTYYAYDARGAALTRHLPNDTWTYYAYDAAGRVTSIADRKSDGTAISTFAFTRDANGNILTSLREDDSCWYYQYDGVQRLTDAEWKDSGGTSLYAYDYQYDKVGNRTSLVFSSTPTYYTYNEANELTVEQTPGVETAYYDYDGRGNQVERSVLGGHTTYFDYNSRNLIARIDSTDPAFTTPNTFAYNALGQRIRKSDSTGTTYYVWDGLNITHEHDGSGTITRRYTHGHTPIEGVFSLIDVEDASNNHYFYHFDQVGGVKELTDDSQSVVQYYEYSPFGRILEDTGSAPNDFTFPATYIKLPDVESLTLSPRRLYDAASSRYASRDRASTAPEYHVFTGNPGRNVDPSGLQMASITPMPSPAVRDALQQLGPPRNSLPLIGNLVLTGRLNPTSAELAAAYRGFIAQLKCWWECEYRVHTCVAGNLTWVLGAASSATFAAARLFPKTPEELAKGFGDPAARSRFTTALSRLASMAFAAKRSAGGLVGKSVAAAINNLMRDSARAFKAAPKVVAVKHALVGALLAEGAVSIGCGLKCSAGGLSSAQSGMPLRPEAVPTLGPARDWQMSPTETWKPDWQRPQN